MAFDFPNSPTTNQIATLPNGVQYKWDGTKWVPAGQANVYAPINSPTFTGNPTAPTPAAGDTSTSIATTAFVAPAFDNIGRNLLHNPLFRFWQRGAGPWTTSTYTADRWLTANGLDTSSWAFATATDGYRTAIGDEEINQMMTCTTNTAGAAGSYTVLSQRIENARRLGGKTITVSFYAAASVNGSKIGVSTDQVFGTGGSPSANVTSNGTSVTVSQTFARYSVTLSVPSTVGKTFGTTAGTDYTVMNLWLSSGSTNATRSGNVGVQNSVTFNISGVQLEIGSVATPLEKPDVRYDIDNCLRFYISSSVDRSYGWNSWAAGAFLCVDFWFPVPMRTTPSPINYLTGSPVNYSSASIAAQSGFGFQLQLLATAAGGASVHITSWNASADL